MNRSRMLMIGAVVALALPALAVAETYGRQEHVQVVARTQVEVVAVLDAGVAQSELHAVNVKYFQRKGDTWVRFTIDNGSVLPGSRITLERPVLKDLKVRQKGGGLEHRALVEVELCLGERNFKALLSVSDRSGYTAPLVIGSRELAALGSVNASKQFTREPSCPVSDAALPAATDVHTETAPAQASSSSPPVSRIAAPAPIARPAAAADSPYQCDGRTSCSQMHSCAEAKFFLANCPGVKMDGNNDGVPCEKQWCH